MYSAMHYADHVLIELLGIWIDKANTGNYSETTEQVEERIYKLSAEVRQRKLKYIKIAIDNEKRKSKTKY